MLKKLTPSQITKIPEYAGKWVSIELCTDPIDMCRVEDAINQCYECAGLDPPKHIFKFDSPLQAVYAVNMLNQSHTKIQVEDQAWNQIKDQVIDQVIDQVGNQIRDQIIGQAWYQAWNQIRDQIRDQIREQFNEIAFNFNEIERFMLYGCHNVHWLAFYGFFQEVCDIDLPAIKGLVALAKECGWWSPYKDIAIVQERPSLIKFDQENRLHCETGPAIQYRDGFAVYAWHGTRVPEAWIMNKDSLNPHDILKHENIEQRRAGCEILGWDHIIDALNPTVIDQDLDPLIGTLLEVNLPDSGPERFLKVQCGTGRTFVIPVPPDSPSALWANAWTYNMQDHNLQRFRDVFRT